MNIIKWFACLILQVHNLVIFVLTNNDRARLRISGKERKWRE